MIVVPREHESRQHEYYTMTHVQCIDETSTAADYGHGNRAGAAISGHGRMGSFTKRAVSFAKSLFYISLT